MILLEIDEMHVSWTRMHVMLNIVKCFSADQPFLCGLCPLRHGSMLTMINYYVGEDWDIASVCWYFSSILSTCSVVILCTMGFHVIIYSWSRSSATRDIWRMWIRDLVAELSQSPGVIFINTHSLFPWKWGWLLNANLSRESSKTDCRTEPPCIATHCYIFSMDKFCSSQCVGGGPCNNTSQKQRSVFTHPLPRSSC